MIEIRPATESEMGQIGLMTSYVYGGAFGDGEDNITTQNNRPEWTLCAFDGPKMVASYGAIPFTARANGRAAPLAGVTIVGTLPEYRRRGLVQGMEESPAGRIVRAEVPLAEMQRYAADLRSMTQGRGVFSMELLRYDELPAHLIQEIVEQAQRPLVYAVAQCNRCQCIAGTNCVGTVECGDRIVLPVDRPFLIADRLIHSFWCLVRGIWL